MTRPYRAGAAAFARLLQGADSDLDTQRMLRSLWRGENYQALATALALPDAGLGTAAFLFAEGCATDSEVFRAASRLLEGQGPRVTASILEGLGRMMQFADADTLCRIRTLRDDPDQNVVVRKYARISLERREARTPPK